MVAYERLKTQNVALFLFALTVSIANAEEGEDWNAKFQATYIWQVKPALRAAYSGGNSVLTDKEKSYSFTTTAALGYRPWMGGEVYLDAEAAQGMALSGLTGFGGYPNGEMARSSSASPKAYVARLFLRQTWGLGGEKEAVESDINQLAGKLQKERMVLTFGNLSVMDIFDNNSYSHDPRVSLLNWALVTHGAYDFAADARGYSKGLALEYYHYDWVLRYGRFALPKLPNQQELDFSMLRHYGDQLEWEQAYTLANQTGKFRVLGFRDVAIMSRYSDALSLAAFTGATPDINLVRHREHTKKGAGVTIEQALTADLGGFARALWADGQTETYAYAEVDQSVSGGLVLKGARWKRAQDKLGVAYAQNKISSAHIKYLAKGGLGFFVGDGQIDYKPETIWEVFYNASLSKNLWLTADGQYIRNPAYNADRGPVKVLSMRLHTEF